ncbi:MAG: methyltransferase domain-containing protein [Fibrobacteres bacterium]|nr:methyltransferase domain-containing protein [Fibrobacterota bacterium]
MDKTLTQELIAELSQRFNLPYHVYQASLCQELVGFQGKDVLEVGGSLPSELVFEYFGVRRWTSVETPDYGSSIGGITHTGTLIGNDSVKHRTFQDPLPRDDYNFFYDDIINLPNDLERRFDLVFSLAAFEHIHRLPQALERMYAALKPGGKLFSYFSPIWSSFHGHHLPDMTDEAGRFYNFNNSPIPPWGHLLMTRPEMLAFLKGHTDVRTAENMVYYIYNANNINRFFFEDYLEFVKATPFVIEMFDPIIPLNQYPEEYRTVLEERFPKRKVFDKDGILMVLKRPDLI